MHEHPRYTIVELIAQGDYAVIYKGRDQELGRDVAIKQIHEQYLHDQQQLERYWQEARLIAQLQYPRIMGIYDIVRDWGWLILELMKGSVPQFLGGKPMDLKDLRIMLNAMAHALRFLEANGIVHGDVKPSNILVDQNRLFKLGDFGIARRLAGDDGSVVKGTTKFMAPEVVSDQFGPVGPQSDLYSLGFTAYALMCGDQFESLFPGLNAFGRDRQIAWMMWHSAPDRRLPEIGRVFQNVPDDIAHVIQKLCEKDPAKRYRRADEVLADLREDPSAPRSSANKDEPAPEDAAKKARNRKRLVIGAVVASLLMSAGIAFIPPQDKVVAGGNEETFREPAVGLLVHVDLSKNRLVIEDAGDGAGAITFDPARDIAMVDGNQHIDFPDLRPGDRIEVVRKTQPDGTLIRKDFQVTRSAETSLTGKLTKFTSDASTISIALTDSPQHVTEVFVPKNLSSILLNGSPAAITELKVGDALDVEFTPPQDDQRIPTVLSIRAMRTIRASGTIVDVDSEANTLTVQIGERQTSLAAAPKCIVTVNLKSSGPEGSAFTLTALKAGESVDLTYDSLLRSIATTRTIVLRGAIEAVDEKIGQISLAVTDKPPATLEVPADCPIVLDGDRPDPIELSALRPGDEIVVTADESGQQAKRIQAKLQKDPSAWALLITYEKHSDQRLAELPTGRADADMLADLLQQRYRIPANQVLLVLDAAAADFKTAIPEFLASISRAGQLIVLFNGNAYVGDDGVPYLATQDFDLSAPAKTGVELSWLLQQLHDADATERILLFDGYHDGIGQDRQWQPSSAAIVKSLRGTAEPGKRPVRIIASCDDQQSNLAAAGGGYSLFAVSCAEGFRGAADRNHDDRVTAPELFEFLRETMPQAAARQRKTQTPDMRDWTPPPAISKEARAAMLELVEYLAQRDPLAGRFAASLARATALAPQQPYPQLVQALALFKDGRQLRQAREKLENVIREHPNSVVANHALAWLKVRDNTKDDVLAGLACLNVAVSNLDDPETEYAQNLFEFSGQLCAYAVFSAGAVSEANLQSLPLTQAVKARGMSAQKKFLAPYQKVSSELAAHKKGILAAIEQRDDVTAKLLEIKVNNLTLYAKFDFDVAMRQFQRELQE